MNKLFTRISMALVGIAMAVGVGVAAGVKTEARGVEAVEETVAGNFVKYSGALTEGDYVFVSTYRASSKDYVRALKNAVTSNKLTDNDITISNDKIVNPAVSLVWHIAKTGDYWTIYNSAVSKYVVATGTASQANLAETPSGNTAKFEVTHYSTPKTYLFESVSNKASSVNAAFCHNRAASGYWACYAKKSSGSEGQYQFLYKKDSLASIAMDGNQTTSFYVGDSFTIGSGKVVPTYSASGAATATNSGLTYQFKANGDAEFGDMPATFTIAHNSGTVKVTYTNASGESASTTYSITVSYATITGLSLDCSTIVLGKTDSHQFVATPTPSNANPSVTWAATSATLTEGNSDDFDISNTGLLSIHSENNGTITVTATSTVDGTKTASCTVTVSGTPIVTLSESAISGVYSGQTGTNALTATAVNFSGAVSYAWESSDATKVSISGSGATITLNYLAACTDVEITVTASYLAEEAEAVCLVSVTASAVTTFTISPTSMNLYVDGTNTIVATVEACGIYDDSVSYVSSAPSVASVNSSGVVTAVAYGTATITVTASDGSVRTCSVTVVDHLNAINASGTTNLNASWTTTDSAAHVNANCDVYLGGTDIRMTGGQGTHASICMRFYNGTLRTYAGNTVTFTPASGVTITSIVFPVSGTAPSGTTYTSATNTYTVTSGGDSAITITALSKVDAVGDITVYYKKTSTTNIANTNFAVQKDLMDYVRTFNSTMACAMDGSTENIDSKWTSVSGAFTTLLGKYSDDNLAHLKALVANATATTRNPATGEANTGDELQNMLARYDWIVSARGKVDFLSSAAGRTAVSSAKVVSSNNNVVSDSSISIIAIISTVSLVAIAGYFVIRRRKENN